jgi:DNA-binding PadR family transcriptional regulator
MAGKRITDEDVLASIEELAGDGYCLTAGVLTHLPGRFSHADRRRALHRAVNAGLVIQRRGPDGREYVAISAEGWRRLRAAA